MDDLDNVPDPANGLLDGDMSDADMAVVEGYIEKLDTLKDLRPPLADNAFKANLAEVITSLNHIKADLKVKKRSAGRRSKKENDPLFLALEGVEDQVARLTQLVRCNLPVMPMYSLFRRSSLQAFTIVDSKSCRFTVDVLLLFVYYGMASK